MTADPAPQEGHPLPAVGWWRVTVDIGRCLGSGSCTGVAAAYFTMAGAAARPRSELVGQDERVLDAAELCPAEAITVRDAVSGAQLAPG